MSLIKWTPLWEPFEDTDRFLAALPNFKPAGFVPSLDVYQDKDNVIVEAPLAGIKPEQVSIAIENDVLTIEGQSQQQSEVDEKNYWRKEVRYGSFHRSIALPLAVNGEAAKAEYDNGILKIVIPKEEKARAKNIKIEIKRK